MQVLNARDFKCFKTLAQMTQPKLQNTVYRMLCKIYPEDKVKISKSAVCAEGEIPICLVAHLDTVFAEPPTQIFYDKEANVMWSPDGLGADDRAGVFSIFKILSDGYRPHIIFTTDEEIGVVGASNLANEPCPFQDLKYIIELDRAGAVDCVFYDEGNKEFQDYVQSFDFVLAFGTFTDIVELCPMWRVSGVNLSIGYINEHSVIETLFVGQMLSTIKKVEKMLDDAENAKYFEYQDAYAELYGNVLCTCAHCGKTKSNRIMMPAINKDQQRIWICDNCLKDVDLDWCDSCNECFMPGIVNENGLCPKCAERVKELQKHGIPESVFDFYTEPVRQSDRVEPGIYTICDNDTI